MKDNYLDLVMKSNQDSQKQKLSEDEEDLKRLRASEDGDDITLLVIAEELYQEECKFIDEGKKKRKWLAFCDKKPGYQMRLVDQAWTMLDNYRRVKKIMEKTEKS